jgi:PAS domain S-box-containing protein
MKYLEKVEDLIKENYKLRRENEELKARTAAAVKESETARQSTEELNAVIEAISDAVYIGNFHGITHCNTSGLRMLGAQSLKDLQERISELGKKFNVRWPDTEQPLGEEELQFTRALRGETVIEEVLATNAQTGKDVYIRAADAPVTLNGKIIGAVAVNSDITDRVAAQKELKKTKEEYEVLFNSMEEGFAHYKALYDLNERLNDILVIEINPAGARLSGKTREEQIGKTWKNVWTGIEDSLFDIYREVDMTGKTIKFEHFSGITLRWYTNTIFKLSKDEFIVTFYDITERKDAEEAVKLRESQMDAFFANSPVILNLVDENFCYINTDKITPTYYGLDRQTIKGKCVTDLSRDFIEQTGVPMMRVIKTGEPIINTEFQAPIQGKGSEIAYWRTSFFRVPLGNDKWGVGVISHEVTDIRRSEQKLKEKEQRLRGIYENAAIGISETDRENRFIDVNQRLCVILGYSHQELKGKSINDITHPEDVQLTNMMNNRLHAGEIEMFDYEKRYIKKDGSLIWVNVTGSSMFDSDGKFIKVINTIEDITERKNAENAIRRSEAILKQAGNMANLGAWEIELDHADEINMNPLYWSEQVFRIFGYEPGSVHVSNDLFFKHVHPDDRKKVSAIITEAIKNRSPYNIEHRILRADGEERTVNEHAEILYDVAGKPLRITGAIQDITEMKQIEKEMIERNEELSRFIYTVSHDLKSPLVTIKMFTSYLRDDFNNPDQDQFEKDLAYVENAADKMGNLLGEILQLSRIGRKEEPKTEVSLEKIVQAAVDLVAGRISQGDVKIIYSAPPIMIYGYARRFIDLYQNLIDNAVKFMGDQPNPEIEIGTYIDESKNNEIVLFVKDNGIGIDQQLQPYSDYLKNWILKVKAQE